MRVAIVHEWLDSFAGSERVLAQMIACYPDAEIFAVVDFLSDSDRAFLCGRKVKTSFIQKLPFARKAFRNYLQLMPLAIEQFDLSAYDIVLSSHHAVAKGILTGPGQVHVSYVHSPIRYGWDLQAQYLRNTGNERGLKSLYIRWLMHRIRIWDAHCANGVDVFIANSHYIARRIQKAYRRDAIVVAPPVSVQDFSLNQGKREGFLVASRFAPYKRVDLIVQAFSQMPQHRLAVVGDGANAAMIARAASGAPNIAIYPPVARHKLIGLMQSARAMIFAAEEDFGITIVEAQACGTPVIAYGVGGAREIIRNAPGEPPTGILFAPQTADAIIQAVTEFDQREAEFSPLACRQNTLRFSEEVFRQEFHRVVEAAIQTYRCL